MTLRHILKWIALAVLTPIAMAILYIALFGWTWLRAPIESLTLEKTGRVLMIKGDLAVRLGWPWPRLQANAVSFANPPWAREKQMLSAQALEMTLDLPQLLRGKIVVPELRLTHPVLFLEQGSEGRKSWLVDRNQQDQDAQIEVDHLTLVDGLVGYDDTAQKTSIRAQFSSIKASADASADPGLVFTADGQYKGLAFKAHGNSGSVLTLRDERTPYPLSIVASAGHTSLQASGSVTRVLTFSAVDMRLALHGDNLSHLYPLLGIAFPATPAYTTEGHLLHHGSLWRYEQFSGHVGASDIAGSGQIDVAGKRPSLSAELTSTVLDREALGPMIGARLGSLQAARQAAPVPVEAATPLRARLLPDQPFKT